MMRSAPDYASLPLAGGDKCSYQLLDKGGITDDIHLFNNKLREWEDYYNYDRPHGALDGQTSYERLLAKK